MLYLIKAGIVIWEMAGSEFSSFFRKEKMKKEGKDDGEDENELPEVDQNTKKSLRQRK
jgi:hypothetical protein